MAEQESRAEPGPVEPRKQSEADQAGVLVWGKITASLSEVLAPLLIVRLLGKGEVGAVVGLLLIYQTLGTIITAGFPRAALYFLADRERGERRALVERLVKTMSVLAVIMAGLMALGGWIGDDALRALGELVAGTEGSAEASGDDELTESLRYLPLLGLYALIDLPTRLLPSVLIAEGRARASAGFGVLRSLVGTLAMLIPAALGYGVFGIIAAICVAGLVPFAIFWRHLYRLYGDAERPDRPIASVRELIRYAAPLGVTDIVNILNANVDLWLIVALFPATAVATYRMGAFQIPIVTTVAYSVGEVYLPRFARLYREAETRPGSKREAVEIWRGSIHKVSLIVVPAAMVFLVGADEFIVAAFTDEYADAVPVFRCYCLLMLGRISAFGSFMIAAGKPRYVMNSAMMTLLSNVVISVPLALTLGFLGPAVGTAIAFVPTLLYYCWFIAKAWGVKLSETLPLWGYLRIVATAAVPGVGAWWLKEQTELHAIVEFLMIAGIMLGGFALLGTLTKLIDREDWAYAWSWVRLKVLKDG
jgi:O-antigen/teichoic acid export membrane protein